MMQMLRMTFAFLARSKVSLLGALMTTCGFLGDVVLIWLTWAKHHESPYLGIFAFAVLPGTVAGGLVLVAVGLFLTARSANGGHLTLKSLQDLAVGASTEALTRLALLVLVLMMVSVMFFGVMGIELFHYTDSTEFCGSVCHNVMSPELPAGGAGP